MTLHRLHAGDGYTYLTKQVAACDHTVTRGQNIADYYTAEGAPPGLWAGRVATALGVDGVVSETQMKALFGEGLHPDAEANIARAAVSGENVDRTAAAQQLGRPFPSFENKVPYLAAVKDATNAAAKDAGKALSAGERQRVRLDVAQSFFRDAHGRGGLPKDLTEFIRAQESKVRHPVAGYDLVFTPQKSISALWGLGDAAAKEAVERAHTEAVNETLEWIQAEAGFTRRGKGSTEQVETDGLVIAQFVHYDNRTGDPNLHTHCAVSNKVRTTADGKWRALDARPLHRAAVAAAARYNSLVADKTARYAGVQFEDRARADGKRPVREIVGFDQELLSEFSRRDAIMDRARELTEEYRAEHGRTPSKAQQIRLVQQATLDTRSGKAPPVSLWVMRGQWRERAESFLAERGADGGLDALLASVQSPTATFDVVTEVDAQQWAGRVIDRVSTARSTWTEANVRTVVEDELSRVRFADPAQARRAVEQVTHAALHRDSLLLDITLDDLPSALTRASGESVFTDHGASRYSSAAVLDAEQRLIDAAHTQTVFTVSADAFDGARARREALESARTGGEFVFNDGQLEMARRLATAETLVAVGVGPAGTGKTASMKLLVDSWHEQGRTVLALGPSAAAATVLGEDVGVPGRTIASVLHRHSIGAETGIDRGTLILVDEAGMASTRDLDQLVALAAEHGAVVRMIGDSAQLGAVDAGGALGMLARETSAPELVDVVRFRDPAEATASLGLRTGDDTAIEFYRTNDRMIGGTDDELLVRLLDDHLADTRDGLSSVMLAPTNEQVRQLNTAAQAIHHTEAGTGDGISAPLSDTARAHVGDVVVTRRNRAELRATDAAGRRFSVQNGDLWTVTGVGEDGSIAVTGNRHGAHTVLPAWYAQGHTELGYAHTIHRAQGLTVDVGRALLSTAVDRQAAYVALTRGKTGNYAYLVTDQLPDPDLDHAPGPEATPTTVFAGILARDGEERAAVEHLRAGLARASDPHRFREYYDTAAAKLGDAHARHLLDTVLPTAIHTTAKAQRGWDAAVAGVRDAVARGADVDSVIDVLSDRGLHGAGNIPVAILARLKNVQTPAVASTVPVLPPQHRGADTELRTFATAMVAAIIDPRGPDAVWATDLDYTHPQQQAYRNAVRALIDIDTDTALQRALPARVAATLTDREWTELARRVVDAALGADTADLDLHLIRFDDTEGAAIRAVVAAVAETVTDLDPDLTAYTDELRSYLHMTDSATEPAGAATANEPATTQDQAPAPDRAPRHTLDERPDAVRTPAHASTDVAAAAEQMRRAPIRALTDDQLDAAAAQARTRLAALDRDIRLANAARTAALGGQSVAAVRAEQAQTDTAAAAVRTAIAAQHRVERAGAELERATQTERAAREPDTGRFGRRTVDHDQIADAAADTDLWTRRHRAAIDAAVDATAAAPPREQWDQIQANAEAAEHSLSDTIAAAQHADNRAASTADATLRAARPERTATAARVTALQAELDRRAALDPREVATETAVRSAQPAASPRAATNPLAEMPTEELRRKLLEVGVSRNHARTATIAARRENTLRSYRAELDRRADLTPEQADAEERRRRPAAKPTRAEPARTADTSVDRTRDIGPDL
ncbi:relaxase domain-containing protein [Rhodococcus sp. BP-149]|uniref:MobF family relaxase n=1 Tax=unclassified Rhodococcus (in: high G+C Gram-positive bacteria) TaxID=192944 RepID=UPI001C9ACA2C|nr:MULTISPECIES: MobF family relaxase [unclassified Rhodococcus (in: high G+C Gram-positive bacteria)]MBY6687470.1 relaxase domain-containing protein [Rhodococcus sp. BP-288]MBY6696435.1 relaxase domain-containing protein [Rhodococcus sp. BP-188]MBY6700567.1 relaxase domain-containing protein [Rhodococcus sp. BP-285]MBY6704410.1 relaxase domain-containing protein [Rhodococcus sp. BP-283]MBY6713692.1 relaxase domain-containing protein [Rhodococcus sp. BP-160]